MCGICGIVNFDEQEYVDKETLSGMCRSIRHRGPDDEGAFLEKGVGLGVQRLKVIDLVTGHQPVHSEDSSIWVVFNGEIYNFMKLRSELEAAGHKFYTHSDTEVIVHAYEQYGEDCVHRFNGMFAFAIWDKRKKKLFLSRDRLGIKPLYYFRDDKRFIFASEIKAILQHPAVPREMDYRSLQNYLVFEYAPAPYSIFKGVRKLLPGHSLLLKNGEIKETGYWDISFKTSGSNFRFRDIKECCDALYEKLAESVERKLVSDVPLGLFLSGGLDSSTVAALTARLSAGRVKTFSVGFEDDSFNELNYARMVSGRFGTQHYELVLKPHDVTNLIPEMVEILDEPFGDASMIPTYLLCKFARRYVTVALSGDGGDEVFAGYPTYLAHRLADFYMKMPGFIRKKIIERIACRLPVSFDDISFDFRCKKFLSGAPYPPEVRNQMWLGSFSPQDEEELLLPQVKEEIRAADPFQIVHSRLRGFDGVAGIDRLMYLDMKFYLHDDILVKVDRASMANSLEVRVPFLDHLLVEFATSLPLNLKLNKLTTKYLMKKTMSRQLPREIINRRKKGFGIPAAKWINGELKEYVLGVFAESQIKREGFFNYSYIQKLLTEHFTKKRDNRKQIWTLLMFELWYRRWMRG